MSGRLKMAVFDLDGTLVDSLGHTARAMATAFTAADLAPPPVTAVCAIIGLPLATLLPTWRPPCRARGSRRLSPPIMTATTPRLVAAASVEPPYEGARVALDAQSAADCVLAVATGKERRG